MEDKKEQLELPKGWAWATVRELARKVEYGSSAKTSEDESGVPVIRMGNIVNGRLINSNLKYLPSIHKEFPNLLLEPGDVLFNRTNSAELVGKTAVYKGHPYPCSFASYLIRIRLVDKYLPDLLSYYINSTFGRKWVAAVVSQQVGQANVNGTKLQALSVPVPPLPEQHRLLAKIEELFTKLDASVESLKKARAQLKRYRQAVLRAAVTGDLTREWREAHKDGLEQAADLLACILRERRAKWEAEQYAKMLAVGKNPKNDDWKKKYKTPEQPACDNLTELPETWVWTSLQSIAEIIDPNPSHRMPEYVQAGIPFISSENFTGSDSIDFSRGKQVSEKTLKEQQARFSITDGDFVLSRIGTIGKTRFLPTDREYCLSHALVVIKTISAEVDNRFLRYVVMSDATTLQAKTSVQSVGVPDLGMDKIRSFNVPLTTLNEQQQIVSEIERLLSIADATERTIEQGLKQAERLRQSILQQAFSGKLILQDPADEPAETLLARIKAKTTRNESTSRKTRRPARKQQQPAQPDLLP